MNHRRPASPTGYRALIRSNANFRWLWYGQIVSLLGDWFHLIASAALVADLTRSGFAIGGLFVVRMLAPFLASPLAGVVADRFNRRNVLIGTDLLRGATVTGFLLVRDATDIWLLYTLTAVQLAISGFFFTARSAILPDIVRRSAIGTANAITSATWSAMLAIGAAAGGLVAGALGIYAAFLIDAATFFLSALLIARIHLARRSPRHDGARKLRDAFAEYAAGLRLVTRRKDVLAIALHKAMLMLIFGSTFQVVQVAISEQHFMLGKAGSFSVGMMFAALGLGTGVGPLAVRHFTGDRDTWLRAAIFAGYMVSAAGLMITSSLAHVAAVMGGSFVVGCGDGLLWVFSTQLLLHRAPDAVRGRVFATEFAFFSLASAAGAATVGAALDKPIAISTILQWMAVLATVPAVVWAVWNLRRTTRMRRRGTRRH